MIHVTIKYKDSHSDKTAVKDAEVAAKYIDAVIRVYTVSEFINDVEKIETLDLNTNEVKQVYPVVQS
jgi:hypothetical protein